MTYGHATAEPDLARDWKDEAACAGYPNSLFFPSKEASARQVEKAKAICSVCPVSEECIEYAMETNQRSGIWGGTTEDERRSLRRKWLATRRRPA
ncbi:MAG: WhiB family transcriptional regulator [Acidimicrobiia bacterium]|nr:WhiB family transcriptional regulator [Acidimicrobiia bacterium]